MKNNFDLKIEGDARIDIAEAFDWYAKISPSLADTFLDEMEITLNYLVDNPLLFQVVYKDFRQVPVNRFPYVLLYKIKAQAIKIYRVFPTKTNPDSKYE